MPKIIDDENVYRVTVELFVKHGYESATAKKIAAAAEIHEATLFRKYGSKENLIGAAFDHLFPDTPLASVVYTGDLRADLLAIVEAYMETNEAYGEIVPSLLVQAGQYPELRNTLERLLANIQNITKIIRQYQEEGLLIEEFPQITVSVLIGPVMARQLFRNAVSESSALLIDQQAYVDAFLRGRATSAWLSE